MSIEPVRPGDGDSDADMDDNSSTSSGLDEEKARDNIAWACESLRRMSRMLERLLAVHNALCSHIRRDPLVILDPVFAAEVERNWQLENDVLDIIEFNLQMIIDCGKYLAENGH